MAAQLQPRLLTVEEYLEAERDSEVKHEFHAGCIYAMAGASPDHTFIATNVAIEVGAQLRGRPCRVAQSDLRVKVEAAGMYAYPNVSVVCGEGRFTDENPASLLNPIVLVEVLSPSTADYDRGAKFGFYRRIESLMDYIVLRQDRPVGEHYSRQPDDCWLLREAVGLDAVVELASIGCTLALSEVYDQVTFPSEPWGLVRDPVADPYAEPRLPGVSPLRRPEDGGA